MCTVRKYFRTKVFTFVSTFVRKYFRTFEVLSKVLSYFRFSEVFYSYGSKLLSYRSYSTVKQLIISYYCICMKIDTSGSSSEVRTKVRNKVRKYESTLYESTYFRTKVLPYFLPNT